MSEIDNRFEAVDHYYHTYGEYPDIIVARSFWEDYASKIAKLHSDGVNVEVVDQIHFRSFYLKGTVEENRGINTVDDLYNTVKKFKEEGKGSWPVRCMQPDINAYLPIQLYPTLPHMDEENEVESDSTIAGDPKREFISVIIGTISGGEI